MNTTGWPELWHVTLAILSRQTPFIQIMTVTLTALFVVMALEGFRSSLRAIWHAHRISSPAAIPEARATRAASSAAFTPRMQSFIARPRRPKSPDQSPRQFRSPRPVIRRMPATATDDRLREAPQGEGDAFSISSPAGNVP